MALVENSFLASLNADLKKQKNREERRHNLLDNQQSGETILKLHDDLQKLADELDDKVERKLNDNETAFFLAYKKHMYTVQKEFHELRQKADEEETKTRRDQKIRSLEKELDWFMNEALRLDELCKKNKKELDKWKGKAEALEDDRQFLENQIKQAKKSNKSLRSSVEKAQTSAYSALVAAEETAVVPAASPEGQAEETTAYPLAIQDASFGGEGGGTLSRDLEQRYMACVKRLRMQLDTEQKYAAKLRSVSDRQFAEPSDLEATFLQCVESIKCDIGDRKREQAESNQRMNAPGRQPKGGVKLPPAQGGRAHSVPPGPPPDPAAGISFDDFTVSDRRNVVSLLLSSEQVLQFLYDKLFPPQAPGMGYSQY